MSRWRAIIALSVVLVLVVIAYFNRGRLLAPARVVASADAASVTSHETGRPGLAETFRAPITLIGGDDVPAESDAPVLRGRVVSAGDGSGVAGAEVILLASGVAVSAITGPRGDFSVTAPKEGNVTLESVKKDGFLPLAPGSSQGRVVWTARRGRAIENVVLTIEPVTVIMGTVRDPSGAPVAAAKITVTDSASHGVVATMVSDERGEFRFSAPLGAIVRADDARYEPAYAHVDPRAGWTRRIALRFASPRGEQAVVKGRVVDEAGAAVSDARVTLEVKTSRTADMPATELSASDEAGRFSFTVPRAGRYLIAVEATGYARLAVPDVAPNEVELVLTLKAGGRLRGRVTGPKGPPASFTVIVWEKQGEVSLTPRAQASFLSETGEFLLEGLAPGSYVASAIAAEHAPSPRVSFAIGNVGAEASVVLELRAGARVFGRITSQRTGSPIGGARVSVEGVVGPGGATAVSSARSQVDGTFSLTGMSAGLGSISVFAEGHHGRLISGISPKEGEDVGPLAIDLRPVAKGDEPKLELVGIGAVLSGQNDALLVREVVEGGGAAAAGIAAGDEIISIDGRAVTDLGFDQGIQSIRGVEGTTVTLTVRTQGAARVLVVPRSRIAR